MMRKFMVAITTAAALCGCSDESNKLSPLADASVPFATAPVDASEPDTSTEPGFRDAGALDAADANACRVINIGILGNPGSLPSSNFQAWLTKAGTTVARIQTGTTPLVANDLTPFDVIILDWLQHDYSPAEVAIVQAFVEAGGGLIAMTGYSGGTSDWRANPLLASLGVSYVGGLVGGPVKIFMPHPITQGLSSVTFNGGYLVGTLGASPNKLTPIAAIPEGNVAYAIEASKGRAFVWGDEWIEFDSEWSHLPEIKQLWVNVFAWIAPSGCPLTPPPN